MPVTAFTTTYTKKRKAGTWYDPGTDIRSDPLYYGRDLIEAIVGNKVEHEIGYHSFSHVRFSDLPKQLLRRKLSEELN